MRTNFCENLSFCFFSFLTVFSISFLIFYFYLDFPFGILLTPRQSLFYTHIIIRINMLSQIENAPEQHPAAPQPGPNPFMMPVQEQKQGQKPTLPHEQVKKQLQESLSKPVRNLNIDYIVAGIVENAKLGVDPEQAIAKISEVLNSLPQKSWQTQKLLALLQEEPHFQGFSLQQMFAFNPAGMAKLYGGISKDYLADYLTRALTLTDVSGAWFSKNTAIVGSLERIIAVKAPFQEPIGLFDDYASPAAQVLVANPLGSAEMCEKLSYLQAHYSLQAIAKDDSLKAILVADAPFMLQRLSALSSGTGILADKAFEVMSENPAIMRGVLGSEVQNGDAVSQAIIGIAQADSKTQGDSPIPFSMILSLLKSKEIGETFVKSPAATTESMQMLFDYLGKYLSWDLVSDSSSVGARMSSVIGAADFEHLKFAVLSQVSTIAIEFGRLLDELHDQTDLNLPNVDVAKSMRLEYLNMANVPSSQLDFLGKDYLLKDNRKPLSFMEGAALLCSDPSYFLTSSNNFLYEKFFAGLKQQGIGVRGFFDKLRENLPEETVAAAELNFAYRTLKYSHQLSNLSRADQDFVVAAALRPISEQNSAVSSFYLLLNVIKPLRATMPGISKKIQTAVQAELGKSEILPEKRYVLEYALHICDEKTSRLPRASKAKINALESMGNFNPALYKNSKGEFHVAEVFDLVDTESNLSDTLLELKRNKFSKAGGKGKYGEDVYVSSDGKKFVHIFRDEVEKNKEFIRAIHSEHENMMFVYRGHSFNSNLNFPPDIFENKGNVFVLLGGCGGTGNIPPFFESNPTMNLSYLAYSSTGRGRVTDKFIFKLLATPKSKPMYKIVDELTPTIEAFGTSKEDVAYPREGDIMIRYLQWRAASDKSVVDSSNVPSNFENR